MTTYVDKLITKSRRNNLNTSFYFKEDILELQQYLDENNFSAFVANAEGLRRFQEAEIERETSLVKKFNIPQL